MTEEDINKKAEKHCNEVLCNAHEKCNEVIKCRDWRSRRAGFFCGYEQALKDFEKENAELKTDYKVLSCSVGDFGELQDKLEEEQRKNNGLSDNLTKAKELLKRAQSYTENLDDEADKLYDKIEQFLNEVEDDNETTD